MALFDDRLCYGDANMKDRALQKMGAAPESPGKEERPRIAPHAQIRECVLLPVGDGVAGRRRRRARPGALGITDRVRSEKLCIGGGERRAAAAWRDVISDAASKRRAALATKDAPPRAVKASSSAAPRRGRRTLISWASPGAFGRAAVGARRELGPKIAHVAQPRAAAAAANDAAAAAAGVGSANFQRGEQLPPPSLPPPPPRPPPLQLPDTNDDFVVTVPVDLQRGLGLELRNGAGTVEVAAPRRTRSALPKSGPATSY